MWLPKFGFDGNLYVSTLFQSHFIAVFVGQCVFDANLLIKFVGPLNRDFGFFRDARVRRSNNVFDGSR